MRLLGFESFIDYGLAAEQKENTRKGGLGWSAETIDQQASHASFFNKLC